MNQESGNQDKDSVIQDEKEVSKLYSFDKPNLVLIDGSAFLFSFYYGMPKLINAKGEPTGAIKGFDNMLRQFKRLFSDSHVIIVFDTKSKNFRHTLDASYKANRAKMPDDLGVQIPIIHELVTAYGLPPVKLAGYEADDIIGTFSRQAQEKGWNTFIACTDKDMSQLVNDKVHLYHAKTNIRADSGAIFDKYGVYPSQFIDYLALMGDSSDNIKGVPKVGEKTASKLLQEYKSLENLLAHANDVKGAVGKSLHENADIAFLAKKLVTICCEVPLSCDDFLEHDVDEKLLQDIYERCSFSIPNTKLTGSSKDKIITDELDFQHKIPQENATSMHVEQSISAKHTSFNHSSDSTNHSIAKSFVREVASDAQSFERFYKRLEKEKHFAFDTETTGLDELNDKVVGVSLAIDGYSFYIPISHDSPVENSSPQEAFAWLKNILESNRWLKVAHNLKFDMHILENHGIAVSEPYFDTMLASYICNSTQMHGLDKLAIGILGLHMQKFSDLVGTGKKQIGFASVPFEKALDYALSDSEMTLQLYCHFYEKLSSEESKKLQSVFNTLEIPLIKVLQKMERIGIKVDISSLRAQSHALHEKIIYLEKQGYEIAGQVFNFNSPLQIQKVLFGQLGLKSKKKTATGKASTNEEVLQELQDKHPLPGIILEQRSAIKLKNTYTDKLQIMADDNGRVHTHFNQSVASTGRLSSADPNLQNIPIRTEEGRKIRIAFVADSGMSLVAADYSQIELRIMAHLSKDKGLLDAFSSGEDVHRATAASVFQKPISSITSDERRQAKAVNFGLMYGMSAFGLARDIGVSQSQAKEFINMYFERYPKVLEYMETTKEFARNNGFVETILGRRLYLSEISNRNANIRKMAERLAINAPLQGTAADIIKLAMIKMDLYLQKNQYKENERKSARMLLQVHDELVFEVDDNFVQEFTHETKQIMESVFSMKVPLVVDIGVGNNWAKAH